jgi:hypothetical protein
LGWVLGEYGCWGWEELGVEDLGLVGREELYF